MPNRDGTGPMGQGPRTGGGWGPCPPNVAGGPGYQGRGGWGGRGHRNRFYATGLTGWQREAQAAAGVTTDAAPASRMDLIEEKLDQVLERLDGLEAKGAK